MAVDSKITLGVITADIGGFIGHISSHPDILDTAKERLYTAREKGVIIDFHVLRCGDDLELIITHHRGRDNREIHEMAWNIFTACKELAEELKLYAPEQGLLKGLFKGTVKNMGPGVAEIEFAERASEPVVILMANKTSSGSWNLPLYKIFADPFNTAGLITEPAMHEGFSFRVQDLAEGREITLSTPVETHGLLALIGLTSRYIISAVYRNSDSEVASVVSAQKSTVLADRVTGKSDPVAILRCQAGFPAVGEVMEAFAFPHLVEGWMRGTHNGPLMPVPFYEANPTRFDGPPRVIGAGFQVSDGRLIGPHDMFDDPSFDETRRLANQVTDYMRRHGPFQPHRSPQAEDYTALPHLMEKFKDRFKKV